MDAPVIPVDEATRLHRLRSLALLDTEAEAVLDSFTELAASVAMMPIALVSLVDDHRQWFKSAIGLEQGSHTPRSVSFCGHAILGEEIFEVPDARIDPRFADNPLVTGFPHVTHYAGAPLVMPGGERIGTICVMSPEPGQLNEHARKTLSQLARSIVRVLVLREDDKQAWARLETKKRILELALEASNQGLWKFWPSEDRLMLTRTWTKAFGYADQDIELKAGDIDAWISPDGATPLKQGVVDLTLGRISKLSLEYEQKTVDGRLVWVRNEAQVAEVDADGAVVLIVGLVRDISAEKETERQLKEAAAMAHVASRAKGDFLATMSHEIRTPINGVIGLSRMLSSANLAPSHARQVALIDSCAKTLLGLVDNILDFSKIEAGQMNLEQVEINLPALLKETCEVFEARAMDKQLTFEYSADAHLPEWIVTDPMRLRQVLLNLLGNALKFTAAGGITVSAGVHMLHQNLMLELEVRDTGIGIAPDQQQRIFDSYAQASISTYREYKGTGLGLSISRQIVHLMGGTITVESVPGAGSTFTVTLPVTSTGASLDRAEAAPLRCAKADVPIVLAEDDAINQMVAQAVLEELGFSNVRLAADGLQALEICEREAIGLVLMDCNMPVMDGLTATRHLRNRGFVAPIVALTAGATLQDKQDCLAAGMNDYLTKPMEPSSLAHALNRWLASEDLAH